MPSLLTFGYGKSHCQGHAIIPPPLCFKTIGICAARTVSRLLTLTLSVQTRQLCTRSHRPSFNLEVYRSFAAAFDKHT